ncbi:MAG: hypothetical protein AB1941_25980 [Gemmatimonadota bacterium]
MKPTPNEQIPTPTEQAELFGVTLAAVVAIVVGDGPFGLWGTVTGIILMSFLIGYRLHSQAASCPLTSFAFGGVFALCGILIAGPLLNYLPGENESAQGFNPLNRRDLIGFGLWLGLAIIVAVVVKLRGVDSNVVEDSKARGAVAQSHEAAAINVESASLPPKG